MLSLFKKEIQYSNITSELQVPELRHAQMKAYHKPHTTKIACVTAAGQDMVAAIIRRSNRM